MKDNNYDDIPINEEYIPRHASNDNSLNYNKDREATIHNWNEEFTRQNNYNTSSTDYKSNNILDNLDKIDYSKYYKVDMDSNIEEDIKEEKEIKQTKPKKKKNSKWPWIILLIIFIIIIIISSLKIILWLKDNKKTSNTIKEINTITDVVEKEDDENTELVNEEEDKTSDYWYYIKFPLIDVDINKLKEKNNDTVGWINVNNTNINYPYVQGKDNNYYLEHSYDKKYNEAGWVFLDYRNNKTLSDKNNILYAHSRLDKTMFGSLSKTLKSNWYNNKDNNIIRLSTETENTLWQIFSVYKIPGESYYITTNFSNDNDYQKFLNTIKGRSIHDFNTTLTTEDKVLTLSTCYSDTERTVVHAKLIKRSAR